MILNYLSFVLAGLCLAPISLRRKRVDVIFVYAISPILQAIPAIWFKWLKGAKLIIWVQDLWPESLAATGFVRNRFLLAFVRFIVRWIYKHADLILVQSEAFMGPVALLADKAKIYYYPNSADDVFAQSYMTQECPIKDLGKEFSVVFAGNLGAAQSVETIINAAYLLKSKPNIKIILVGDGSRSDWMREQLSAKGLSNVVMAGRYPLEAMPGILGRADALLVTLKDEPIFYQTIPSKIQAYLAIGRPIIACINGEGARIVREARAGIDCAAEDSAALAASIIKLAEMGEAERAVLGKNGRLYFENNFNSDKLIKVLIKHMSRLVNQEYFY